jgi:tetratricopeptide (TPR) repeat protein
VPEWNELCGAAPDARPRLLVEELDPEALAWVVRFVDPADGPVRVRARAEEAFASWRALREGAASQSDTGAMIGAFVQLLEAAYLLENLWPADAPLPPADLLALYESAYDGLRLPAMFSTGWIQQLGRLAAGLFQQTGAPGDVLVALLDLARVLPDRARVLHRHVALPLACDAALAATVRVEVLRHLGAAAREAADFGEAYACLREAARLAPDDAGLAFAHAQAAYRAIRPAAGDAAEAEAAARCGPGCAVRPADLDAAAEASRRLAAGCADDFDGRLACALACETLDRRDQAARLYEAAAEERPQDARPFTGLARLVMRETLDVARTLPILEAAGPENRDADYYQILVAARGMVLAYDVLPRIIADPENAVRIVAPEVAGLRAAVESYAGFEPARGGALLVLIDVIDRVIARFLAEDPIETMIRLAGEAIPRLMDLVDRYPDSPDAVRLAVSAVPFALDAETALAVLALDLPEPLRARAEFLVRRASLVADAVIRWNRPDRMGDARRLAADLPDGGLADVLRADAELLGWRLAVEPLDPTALRDRLVALLEDPAFPTDERARTVNNLGVLLAVLGEPGPAAERFRRSEDLSDESGVTSFNRLALTARSEELDAETLAEVEGRLAERARDPEGNPVIRRTAFRWLARIAGSAGRVDEADALLAEADAVRGNMMLGHPEQAELGLLTRGKFSFGLGYSTLEGLTVDVDTSARIWLLLRANDPPAP